MAPKCSPKDDEAVPVRRNGLASKGGILATSGRVLFFFSFVPSFLSLPDNPELLVARGLADSVTLFFRLNKK